MSYYSGRIISYALASSSTWYMNRRFTFADSRNDNRLGEWMRFVALNLSGGAVNYAIYAAYIRMHAGSTMAPAIGVALGSLAGMLVNFHLSKRLVFNRRPGSDFTVR
jgi:putative flippase GtrA